MSTQTINAAQNPALANSLLEQAQKETAPPVEEALVVPPSDTVVTLPGGYVNSNGEVITSVEVKELNGRDEEAIAKATNIGRVISTILSRGTVKIGDEPVTEEILDQLYAGDRDAILLGIYKATFGPTANLAAFCRGCEDYKSLQISVDEDIETVKLHDPIEGRRFTVKGKKDEYTLVLPTGKTQKELLINSDKTMAELTTILLEGTIREINNRPVFSTAQVQEIGVADRRKISDALSSKAFGPVFNEVTAACPDCGGEVAAPINVGTLFQF